MDITDIDEKICHVTTEETPKPINRNGNFSISAFVNAYARIRIHKAILELNSAGFDIFYCDTDNIIFAGDALKKLPISLGLAIGEFRNEFGSESQIESFFGYGRKNFHLTYKSNRHEKKTHALTKVCGMTLTPFIVKEKLLSAESRNSNISIQQLRHKLCKNVREHVPTIQSFTLKNEITCERHPTNSQEIRTVPWGFISE